VDSEQDSRKRARDQRDALEVEDELLTAAGDQVVKVALQCVDLPRVAWGWAGGSGDDGTPEERKA
jgi:hypothetical protein